MYRRAVPDHQHLARDLAHEVLEEAYRVLSLEGSLLLDHVELTFEGYPAHRRKVISREIFFEDGRLSHRGVSAHYHSQQVEARLIGKHYGPAFLQRPFFEGRPSLFFPVLDGLLVPL